MKLYVPVKSNRKFKKRKVLVKNPKTERINTVHYGDNRYEDYLTHKDKKRRDNFRKRHNCDSVEKKGDKTKPGYWACSDLWPKDKVKVKGSKNRRATLRRIS